MRLQILEFAHLVFRMDCADLDVVQMSALELVSQSPESLLMIGVFTR